MKAAGFGRHAAKRDHQGKEFTEYSRMRTILWMQVQYCEGKLLDGIRKKFQFSFVDPESMSEIKHSFPAWYTYQVGTVNPYVGEIKHDLTEWKVYKLRPDKGE